MVPGYGLGQGHGKGYGQGYGSGFRVSVMVRFRDQCQDHGSLFIVHCSWFKVQGSGSGFRVRGHGHGQGLCHGQGAWPHTGMVRIHGCTLCQGPWLHTLLASMPYLVGLMILFSS